MKHYLSLDVETRGVLFNNPVCAIGVYVAPVNPTQEGGARIKKRWALAPLPGQEDEARCVTEFWDKFPEVDDWIKKNARPAAEVMALFRGFCHVLATILGARNIIILTDCPDTDLARLDYLGQTTGTWTLPVRYLDIGVRHSQADPSERLEQLGDGAEDAFDAWMAEHHPGVHHTHFPDEDAEHSYWQMIYCDARRPAKAD